MALVNYTTVAVPLRISFSGGGTDLPSFYKQRMGAVLSTSIDKYIYVTVKKQGKLFGSSYRLNYSETEIVEDISQIKNNIARECLQLLPVDPPLYIATIADLPANSGLGSSSSFAVGLLKALHMIRGEEVCAHQVAEEACEVEIHRLNRPTGKQDAYAAAIGGINIFRFYPDEQVECIKMKCHREKLNFFFSHLLMFWTGITRDSATILSSQEQRFTQNFSALSSMADQVDVLHQTIDTSFCPIEIGRLLHQNWTMKKSLSTSISNSKIDQWYQIALDAGAYGGKLCGAGGGGFLVFLAPTERHDSIRQILSDLVDVKVGYDQSGVQEIFSLPGHSNEKSAFPCPD